MTLPGGTATFAGAAGKRPGIVPPLSAAQKRRQALNKRDELFELKDLAGEILGEDSAVYGCMHKVTAPGGVEVRYDGEKGYIKNIATCKQVHTCPICSREHSKKMGQVINKICAVAARKGLSALDIVVTGRHTIVDPYKPLLDGIIESWRFVFSGDRTGERKYLKRVKHQIKHIENRYSPNGHHPHLHMLLLVDESGMSDSEKAIFEDQLSEVICSRYTRKMNQLGFIVDPAVGYYCEPVKVWGAAAHYMRKIELELTHSEGKQSEYSYSMFQLLALYKRGTKTVFGRSIPEIFREYAQGMKGKRAFSFSENIKDLGIDISELKELDEADEDATREKQEKDPILAMVDTGLWWYLVRNKLVLKLYQAADTGDAGKVEVFLNSARQAMELTRRLAAEKRERFALERELWRRELEFGRTEDLIN